MSCEKTPDQEIIASPWARKFPKISNGMTTQTFFENRTNAPLDRKSILECMIRNSDQLFEGIVSAEQVHGSQVNIVDEKSLDPLPTPICTLGNSDGIVTQLPGIALAILTADCVPISLIDKKTGTIGVIHAGWRGLLENIVENAVDAMKQCGAKPDDIHVWLGPAIGVCCYEVGNDLLERFKRRFPDFKRFGEGTRLNLQEIGRQQAICQGVLEDNIALSEQCTKCHPHTFYSHRRQPDPYGRMVTFIAKRP